ncbi:hypothetical protein EVAR_20896_1 [Eumeta japonica]|uniref:Uncharacterized protein n=1 Tax=Eumeta variegata TaxID=151549 RepID=A0A4C1UVB4_EUMVA|nr:hypothetical protein EVAR_20896_1 [Eumeta japonica]
MEGATSCLPGAGGIVKKQVIHAFIKDIVTKALQDMDYECPVNDLDRFVCTATPASSFVTSPASSQASSHSSSRSSSPSKDASRAASTTNNEVVSSPPTPSLTGPSVVGTKPTAPPGVNFRPAAASSYNPWVNDRLPQPLRTTSGLHREANQRAPPVPPPVSATAGPSSFRDDVQTVMVVLRAVKSSEISDVARDMRACRNVEEKLLVLVRYYHLMVK